MNIRTLAVFAVIITTIGIASMSMISTYAPVDAASCHQHHHHPTGNDDCQGDDNNSGNQNTGSNENGDN